MINRVNVKASDYDSYTNEVYNCFINSAVTADEGVEKNREFSTCDIFPTVLASLGVKIDGDRLALGTNLFSGLPTIPERMGRETFYDELQKSSRFYKKRFIENK